LNDDLEQAQANFEHLQDLVITVLTNLTTASDYETGCHLVRSQRYVEVLAKALKDHPRFADDLSGEKMKWIVMGAPLHDIGKVGIPEGILLKPNRITPEEWQVMKTHAKRGADLLRKSMESIPHSFGFVDIAIEIAHWHHERWDGSGYPDGLRGEEIPTSARLMAVADVFDALISFRSYKKEFSLEEAKAVIVRGKGTQFDPDVVDAFCAHFHEFAEIFQSVPEHQQPVISSNYLDRHGNHSH